MITENSSANHTAAIVAAIKGQICSLIDPVTRLCCAYRCVFDWMQITGKQVARNRTKKSPEKMGSSKCCGVLRAFAGMTEIANEPKPRSKLLRACEQKSLMRPPGKNEALDRY